MALETKKKEKETAQSLLHRFTKSVQRSGVLRQARKDRFRERPLSQTAKKRAALRKEETKEKYAKLRKLGQLVKKGK